MQDDAGEFVDLYIPRKCSMTNRLIGATDYAAVQFNVGHVSEDGCATAVYALHFCAGACCASKHLRPRRPV